MSGAAEAGDRIATLDIVRGVAVMGILAMNILAFSMPGAAYLNPMAYGTEGPADIASWLFSFILIDGKMRGLFSFLFGASTLLVVERAVGAGESGAAVHSRRMIWLLGFGLLHFYFIWWGDILSLYAPIGMIAYLFWRMRPRTLIWIAALLIALQTLLFAGFAAHIFDVANQAAAPGASREAVRSWAEQQEGLGLYTPAQLADTLALYRGSYAGILDNSLTDHLFAPVNAIWQFGMETLAYMLLGMAALKSGFLAGAWGQAAYRRAALIGFGIGVPVYALLGWLVIRDHFAVPMLIAASIAASVPVRPLMIVATAALIILLTRRRGALTQRIAAAGRAAFTNYLGTSLVMTTLFYGYGFGLYGHLRRIELWVPVLAMWALMLLWSKPWLDRFHYGPFEWLWRSLARWSLQPMRR